LVDHRACRWFDVKPGATSPIGALGIALALLAAITGAVVAAEYDPEAARLDAIGLRAEAIVVSIDSGTVEIELPIDGRPRTTISPSPPRLADLSVGGVVEVLHDEEDPITARLMDEIPGAPREANAFVLPVVLLGLAGIAVIIDPRALYGTFLADDPEGRTHE
jgi:hypothetical protein